MTQEMLIIAAVRVAGSLPVLRWPLLGGVLALLVDQSDLFMMNLIDLGGVSDYQRFDKYLDQVYMLAIGRSEEHTSELQSRRDLVCRLLLDWSSDVC